MSNATGLFVVLLVFLMGKVAGMQPNNGYCIGNKCFTVFLNPISMSPAQLSCKAQSGHLMTVRSSVSHDALSILLANFKGRFWVGLQLSNDCPEDSKELKGYEWATADTKSDFTNWLPGFDNSCSAPSCVSVSKENEFKWTQTRCTDVIEGFLCENSFDEPCKGFPVAPDESMSYMTPFGFEVDEVLSLPPGSVATLMPNRNKYLCYSKHWLRAPWKCEIFEGGCEHKCAVDLHKDPSCNCPPGQTVNPVNKVTCETQTTDDPCARLGCEGNCNLEGDSYACTCGDGFQLASNGKSCVDFDECADKRQCPRDNTMCVNTVGSFRCICKEGFSMSAGQCVDMDECASGPCEHACLNYLGGYTCTCYEGYIVDKKSPDKCALYCGRIECPAVCDPNNKFQCYCPEGYLSEERDSGTVCIEIDECEFSFCEQNCQNSFGSYLCSCEPGYTLVGEVSCVKNEDEDPDGGTDGSGMSPTPNIPTVSSVPYPGPTLKPRAVTVGGLVGIIVCTVFFIVLLVFVTHLLVSRRGKMESAGALKAEDGEAHGLQQVTGVS